jgi:hypothetical protein
MDTYEKYYQSYDPSFNTVSEYEAAIDENNQLCEDGRKEIAIVKELQQQLEAHKRRIFKSNIWDFMRVSSGEKRREILHQIEADEAEWKRLSQPIYEQLELMKPLFIEGSTLADDLPNPFWKNKKWQQGYWQSRKLFERLTKTFLMMVLLPPQEPATACASTIKQNDPDAKNANSLWQRI